VEYKASDGQTYEINVRREVILSAGAIGSPKVLELSGVGNSMILCEAGVESVLDFPTVGENLADHVHSWANAFTNASQVASSFHLLLLDPSFAAEQQDLWFHNRTGQYN
ncbi:hypothetical protein BYT27DRAFT_7082839, partial [Phlegmacium glaucopus]